MNKNILDKLKYDSLQQSNINEIYIRTVSSIELLGLKIGNVSIYEYIQMHLSKELAPILKRIEFSFLNK